MFKRWPVLPVSPDNSTTTTTNISTLTTVITTVNRRDHEESAWSLWRLLNFDLQRWMRFPLPPKTQDKTENDSRSWTSTWRQLQKPESSQFKYRPLKSQQVVVALRSHFLTHVRSHCGLSFTLHTKPVLFVWERKIYERNISFFW